MNSQPTSSVQESDVRVLAQRINTLDEKFDEKFDLVNANVEKSFSKLDRVADNLGKVAEQIAIKEETDKHLSEKLTTLSIRVEKISSNQRDTDLFIAAQKPWADYRNKVIPSIIIAVILGLAAVFYSNPFK